MIHSTLKPLVLVIALTLCFQHSHGSAPGGEGEGAAHEVVVDGCSLSSLLSPTGSGTSQKMLVNLQQMKCMVQSPHIKRLFGGTLDDDCTLSNMFFRRKLSCPAFYGRRTMVHWIRSSLKKDGSRIKAHPLFLLHICRLGDTFTKAFKDDGTCAVETDDEFDPEFDEFEITNGGVHVCRTSRRNLIYSCKNTMDPFTKIKRSETRCILLFKEMLHVSIPIRSRAETRLKMEPTETEAAVRLEELVSIFKMNDPPSWKAAEIGQEEDDEETTATTTTNLNLPCPSNGITFTMTDTEPTIKRNFHCLFSSGGKAGSYWNKAMRLEVLKIVGSHTTTSLSLPNQRLPFHKKIFSFLVGACKGTRDCMKVFLKTEQACTEWPDLQREQTEIKEEWKKYGRKFGAALIGYLPCLTRSAYTTVRALSVTNDILYKDSGRRFLLYSWTSSQADLKVIIGDRDKDLSIATYQPKSTSQPRYGAQVALGRSVEHLLNEEISFTQYWDTHHTKELMTTRILFEVTLVSTAIDPYCTIKNMPGNTNFHYNFKGKNYFICRCVEKLKDTDELCPPPPRNGRRQQRGDLQEYHVHITKARGKDAHLVVFFEIERQVWLKIAEKEDWEVPASISCPPDTPLENMIDANYIADSFFEIDLPIKPVIDYKMYCGLDAADVWRKADDDKSSGSFTKLDCMSYGWTRTSGLNHNLDLNTFVAIWNGKDDFETVNGFMESNSGMRRWRDDHTTIIQARDGAYVGWNILMVLDSMAAEALGG